MREMRGGGRGARGGMRMARPAAVLAAFGALLVPAAPPGHGVIVARDVGCGQAAARRRCRAAGGQAVTIRPMPETIGQIIQRSADLFAAKRNAEAIDLLERLRAGHPDHWTVRMALGSGYLHMGRGKEAYELLTACAAENPSDYELQRRVVVAALSQGRHDVARAAGLRMIELRPDAETNHYYAAMMATIEEHAESRDAARRAVNLQPGRFGAHAVLGHSAISLGRPEEALEHLEACARLSPSCEEALELRALAHHYNPGSGPEEVAAAARSYGAYLRQAAERYAPDTVRMFPEPVPAAGPVRVGFISSDLRRHSVSYFFHAVLAHHDASLISPVVYSTTNNPDGVTRWLKDAAPGVPWRELRKPGAGALAKVLRADRVHLAVDLHGITNGHPLRALAMRPTHSAATYLGYPGTTGLASLHGRVVDALTDPPGAERYAVEPLYRIAPCFLCYTPTPDSPPAPERPPVSAPGRVVLASMNALAKLNDPLLRRWARLLGLLPEATLLIKSRNLERPGVLEDFHGRVLAAGIPEGRFELIGSLAERNDHLAVFERAHIGLDAFPYHGTTTTCECLMMNLPVVTQVGDRHAARVGLSLLSAVGLPELVAHSEEQYIEKVVALAHDTARLADYHRTLRQRMLASPLCDGPAFGPKLSRVLADIARRVRPAAVEAPVWA
ncbi:MAG: hypothetical protein C0468_06055 [Planctomyces sp.]|nr:hypothetical protein [Planctomyces sp.]